MSGSVVGRFSTNTRTHPEEGFHRVSTHYIANCLSLIQIIYKTLYIHINLSEVTSTWRAPAAAYSSCMGDPVAQRQVWLISSSLTESPAAVFTCSGRVSYLVAVYSVLGRPGSYGDGVWLAAAVSLAVSVFTSLPANTAHSQNEKGITSNQWQDATDLRKKLSVGEN